MHVKKSVERNVKKTTDPSYIENLDIIESSALIARIHYYMNDISGYVDWKGPQNCSHLRQLPITKLRRH